MIVKLREVYRDKTSTSVPMAALKYKFRDIFINPEHVIYIRQNSSMPRRLAEGLVEGADSMTEFCTISLSRGQSGTDVVVAGSIEEINDKLVGKEILHG